ncbi:MAG TPA: hypothetical protein VN923_00100 [Thermoanaerobaculia bacterium]|nr:hypothetical protein [Thermoanaerobaculia bacterium]
MGNDTIHCFLGFSMNRSNEFSEQLERRAAAMQTNYHDSFFHLQLGLGRLHDAVDAALAGDDAGTRDWLTAGLGQLAACNGELTALAGGLVRARSELFERGEVEPDDPLVTREPFFAELDYEAIYRDLLAERAALPLRAYWDDLVARVKEKGTHGAMRLIDRELRELQSDLRAYIADVEATAARLEGRELAAALHDSTVSVARLMVGYTRVLTTFSYLTILCERASALQESAPMERTVAAAG